MLRSLEEQARRLRHEQRIGQQIETAAVAAATGIPTIRARAHRTAAQTGIAASAFRLIVFNVEDYDLGGGFSISTGRYTVPQGAGGYYFVHCMATLVVGDAATIIIPSIHKNAVESARGDRVTVHAAGNFGVMASDVMELVGGDIVDFRIFHTDGSDASTEVGAQSNRFAVHRLSV